MRVKLTGKAIELLEAELRETLCIDGDGKVSDLLGALSTKESTSGGYYFVEMSQDQVGRAAVWLSMLSDNVADGLLGKNKETRALRSCYTANLRTLQEALRA